MTSHIHMIIGTETGVLSDIIRDFKSFTSRHIRKEIEGNLQESRRECLPASQAGILNLLYEAGSQNERNNDFQFWQQHNHPIELDTDEILQQRLDYIHNNPVEQGLVEKEEVWLHSNAGDYYGVRKGEIELIFA